MDATNPDIPEEVLAAIRNLDEALAPLIPEVGDALARNFPQTNPAERLQAMRAQMAADWPAVRARVPLLESLDLPSLAAPKEGEETLTSLERCFTLMCFATAMTAAFMVDEGEAVGA